MDLYSLSLFAYHHPVLFYSLLFWTLFWKGLALWKASQKREKIWFIVLFIVNTVGLLEILYLFIFSKYVRLQSLRKKSETTKEENKIEPEKEKKVN